MSRTVADATRFTATAPHAYSKPASILRSAAAKAATFSPSSSPSPVSSQQQQQQQAQLRRPPPSSSFSPFRPPPSSPQQQPPSQPETPAQKVARIRALRAAEKLNALSLWDRIVVRGRVVADVAHRVTVFGLIGATVLAFIVTSFSLTDMILYNRRQRSIYFEAQESIYAANLMSAIDAEKAGRPLTEDEQSTINRERMVLKAEAEAEERKKRGWGVKKFFFGGLGMGEEEEEEGGEGGAGNAGGVVDHVAVGGGEKRWGNAEVEGRESLVEIVGEKVEATRREGERVWEEAEQEGAGVVVGGPLDRMTERLAEKGKEEVEGWKRWVGWGK
ncbi:MAG: hypothetical protein Q9220_001095 [cf. Caloplaca sp. 1 TL-2023]